MAKVAKEISGADIDKVIVMDCDVVEIHLVNKTVVVVNHIEGGEFDIYEK